MKDLKTLIKTKSIFLTGGNVELRDELIKTITGPWPRTATSGAFILKSNIKNAERFVDSIRKTLPVTSPLKGYTKEMMGFDQIKDYWLEWISELGYTSVLLVIPEVQSLAENKRDGTIFDEMLCSALRRSNELQCAGLAKFRVVATFDKLPADIATTYPIVPEALPVYFRAKPIRPFLTREELFEVISI